MKKTNNKTEIGWREYVGLSDLNVEKIKVKVDTGARTSSLHAHQLKIENIDGIKYASFFVYPDQDSDIGKVKCSSKIEEFRQIKSSNGASELRPVILTSVQLGDQNWIIELTLTNRDEMGFRMLLGRSGIKGKFLVNPGKSFIIKKEEL